MTVLRVIMKSEHSFRSVSYGLALQIAGHSTHEAAGALPQRTSRVSSTITAESFRQSLIPNYLRCVLH